MALFILFLIHVISHTKKGYTVLYGSSCGQTFKVGSLMCGKAGSLLRPHAFSNESLAIHEPAAGNSTSAASTSCSGLVTAVSLPHRPLGKAICSPGSLHRKII